MAIEVLCAIVLPIDFHYISLTLQDTVRFGSFLLLVNLCLPYYLDSIFWYSLFSFFSASLIKFQLSLSLSQSLSFNSLLSLSHIFIIQPFHHLIQSSNKKIHVACFSVSTFSNRLHFEPKDFWPKYLFCFETSSFSRQLLLQSFKVSTSASMEGGCIAQWMKLSLLTQRPRVQFLAFPRIFFEFLMLPRLINRAAT